jgi:hypothetical protein
MLDDAGVSVPWPQVKKLVERHWRKGGG